MNPILLLALLSVLLLASLLALAWLIQRIRQKLQTRVPPWEARPKRIRPVSVETRVGLRALAVLLVAVVLAVIPPALVMADRWFHLITTDLLRDTWCQSSYACGIWLPSYFLLVLASVICLLIFMYFQRRAPVVVVENRIGPRETSPVSGGQSRVGRYLILGSICGFVLIVGVSLASQQYPGWSLVLVWMIFLTGWFLRAFTLTSIRDAWKKSGTLWISMLLTYATIAGTLTGYFGRPQIFGATVVLLLIALANLWRFRRRIPPIFWIVSLALIVYTLNINGWWTSVVGDEYSFPEFAWRLADKTGFAELGQVLFKADGVFGAHPYLSSILQAIPIKLLGYDNFSWRFSNPLLCSLAVGLFYLFCTTFISKRQSLIAAFLLAVSSYVMSFGKIGYNNLQALFAMALVLTLTAWALRARLPLAFACLGSALALCFYLYPAALYVIPLSFLLLALYDPPLKRTALGRWALLLAVAAALLYPLLLQPVYWQAKVAGTFFNQPALLQSTGTILNHFVDNVVYSVFSFLYIPAESHYIASSYLDPLTAAFFLIGVCLLIYQLRRQRFALFVLLSFIFLVLSVGASHDRATPPNTRMFLLLPVYALIAMWGVVWVDAKVRQVLAMRAGRSAIFLPILLIAIAGANLVQAYPLSHIRSTNLQMIDALFIRLSQRVYEAEPVTPKVYAVVVNEARGTDGLLMLQKIYPHLAQALIHQIRITKPALPESALSLLADRNTLIILAPWLDSDWVTQLEPSLRALGKERCDIVTAIGEKRFELYYDPSLHQACDP